MGQAKSGDRVIIHFTGKRESGEVFATSKGEEPLEFILGEGKLLPGIERAVEGMAVGEEKTTHLSPDEGYGPRRKELVVQVDRAQFPEHIEPEVGMELQVPQPDGSVAFLTIVELEDEKVTLDANHPLAGEKLSFELELLEIRV